MTAVVADQKLREIKYLVSTLPRAKLFKSFIFDDNNVWVSFYAEKLKQILSIAFCEYQQEKESEETLWKFMNTSTTKVHSNSVARNLLHHSMNKKNSMIEIFFPIEKLALFVGLVNKLSQKSPDLVMNRKKYR
eukprot:TRINITY_DN4299_c0_g2_i1.p1 TRINITY_DN4299_c0_g2~~TRINITY_DN4299_c0_g2_i1.p1  ORF type:complete len:133 (-),score=36.61 TRINITY_DN4299_c0_g2_i1:177-575(-)